MRSTLNKRNISYIGISIFPINFWLFSSEGTQKEHLILKFQLGTNIFHTLDTFVPYIQFSLPFYFYSRVNFNILSLLLIIQHSYMSHFVIHSTFITETLKFELSFSKFHFLFQSTLLKETVIIKNSTNVSHFVFSRTFYNTFHTLTQFSYVSLCNAKETSMHIYYLYWNFDAPTPCLTLYFNADLNFACQDMTLFSKAHTKRNSLSKNLNYPLRCLTLYSPTHFEIHFLIILNFACPTLQSTTNFNTQILIMKFWHSCTMSCFVFLYLP